MPLVQTRGAASAQGFGEFAQVTAVNYIENVFSTYLYTGTGAALTITNNIDLSTKGGLVWIKDRSNAESHSLWDTARGVSAGLQSNATSAQYSDAISLTAYNSNGFSLGADTNVGWVNRSPDNYVSWTFREQPKFFDVVTYTGTGVNRTVAHNLNSVPGCIIVKDYANAGNNWKVYHRSLGGTKFINLSATTAAGTDIDYWNNTDPTSAVFTVGIDSSVNGSGRSYVAYIFAHDAGGFGLTGTDNVISCGSFTTDGSGNATVSLGYEPQWILYKPSSSAGEWELSDTMRGWSNTSIRRLYANTSDSEQTYTANTPNTPNATGFQFTGLLNASSTYIYIAIRRGPMKVPTLGTSVFEPVASSASTGTIQTTGFPVDMQIAAYRPGDSENSTVNDRLRGVSSTAADKILTLKTSATTAESTINGIQSYNWGNTGFGIPTYLSSNSGIYWNFQRAPSFFDEVCSAGTGSSNQARTHNLGAVPELIFVKDRSSGGANWVVYSATLGQNFYLNLNNTNNQQASTGAWGTSAFTASTFYCLDTGTWCATIGNSGVFYLFATCAGVSKVGSYSGNTGVTVVVPCGFTSGVRFVLIKRTDSTGDWYVWDSARGIIAGNDPYLLLNSTAAEVTSTDYVDTYSAGFEVTSTAPAALNATGGTYIFLAIA